MKIFLTLIFLSSLLFSYTCPAVIDGRKLTSQHDRRGVVYQNNISAFSTLSLSSAPNDSSRQYWIVFGNTCVYADATGGGYKCDQTICSYVTVTCPSGQSLNNDGECVFPDPLDCKKVEGQYSNLDGTCTDCSNFLTDSSVDGMANCACGAVGSSYNGQSFLGTTSFSENGYKYSQSEVKCADGNKGYVYYGKIPLDNNSSDNNTTSPDNNSTKPSDGNSTIPSDNNGTQDGNGTKDGNGTGSGKDYTKYLETIVDQLKGIGEDTDNLGGINNGINGTFPTTSFDHSIPSDTSGGNFDTYQEAWSNLIDSLNEVSNKVNEFNSLVQNGFSNPFSKGSVSTCRYTTSFEFGLVGSIPVDFDLCSLVSPLYSIFYTFAYIFFVYVIFSFCVRIFFILI